jgi:hypothetical protein
MRASGFRNVGALAQRLTSGMAKGRGTSIAGLQANWSAIVGADMARSTQPDALLSGRGGRAGAKTLRLRVSGAAALEVQHMSGQLVERVNAFFGHRVVEDIRLQQGIIARAPAPRLPPKPTPAAKQVAEQKVADVKDPELRAALARLGAHVASGRRGVLLGLLGVFAFGDELRAQPNQLAITEKDRVLGRADAPNTIVEYASLSCWSCARFHNEVLPVVKRRWIDNGRAKLVYRHFPLDSVATKAAHLVECLPPASFFGAVEAMFKGQDSWVRAADPGAESAKVAGISGSAAYACQVNPSPLNKVLSDVQSGQALGVTSTPTLFINGQNHGNPGDPDAIEAILRKGGR